MDLDSITQKIDFFGLLVIHSMNLQPRSGESIPANWLPDEVWWIIFDNLPNWNLLIVRFTCRYFRDILNPLNALGIMAGSEEKRNFPEAVAEEGCLELLQWARENGCPWDFRTCEAAARGGHLEVLQWAREHGCPWDEDTW